MQRRVWVFGVVACVLVALAGPAAAVVKPLPTGTDVDYQLGGSRSVPANVGIVARDRTARPIPGKYNVCYVNA